MQRLGFIHDMMDVKVLILYVTARSQFPMTIQQIYEVSFQDDCLSYFDVCTAIPEMVRSGHLQEVEGEKYIITEKGRHDGELTAEFNRQTRRSSVVDVAVQARQSGDYSVTMVLKDGMGELMKLELMAPDQRQANRLSKLMEMKAEEVYDLVMADLLDEEEV